MLNLLKCLLEFNPYYRLSAKEALQLPLFDKIRESHFEKECSTRIKMEIHSLANNSYNEKEKGKFTIMDYKKLLINEVEAVNN